IPRNTFSHTTTEAFPSAIRAGERIAAHVCDGEWREMSTLERYLGESLAVMEARGVEVVTGERTVVDDGANVSPSVLWDDVRVERGATVKESVLGDGVVVREGERIERSVVVRASIAGRVERGEVQGDNLVVPLGPVLD